jgi:hypothetical protein
LIGKDGDRWVGDRSLNFFVLGDRTSTEKEEKNAIAPLM